ncbi:MAG: zf-HC2 domain-containing protein [Opitutaceae bacterium]|nr:zf-HC2 domain-containing protein [Opitutaceae bacterium]
MKDTEFIELLNLYLDHELTPADCARLEAEVKANPARRGVYEQYCRMHKACSVLAADFAAVAPAADARALRTTEAETASGRLPIPLFALGSMAAAAAAVAFFLLARTTPTTRAGATLAQQAPVAALATDEMPARSGGIVQRPALMGDSIFLTRAAPGAGNAPVAPQLAWLTDVQVSPIQPVVSVDALRFETKLNAGADAPVASPALKTRDHATEHYIGYEFRR